MDVKQSGRADPARRERRPRPAARGILPSLLGYQLRLAQRAIFADFALAMGDLGISPGLFGILVIVDANAGLTQQALADAAHLDRSTVVTVIDKLEARGLVERRAADRRSNGLHLTAEGAALLRRLRRKVATHERRVIRNLTPAERETLLALLQKILPERR